MKLRMFQSSFENPNQAAGGISMGNSRSAKARRSGGCWFETWFPPARDPPLGLVLELLKVGRLWKTLGLRHCELIFKPSMIESTNKRPKLSIVVAWFLHEECCRFHALGWGLNYTEPCYKYNTFFFVVEGNTFSSFIPQ